MQEFRNHFTQVQANILNSVSQAEPEETPVEPPPIQSQGLPQNSAVLERIKACGAISIYKVSQGPAENAPKSPVFKRAARKKPSTNMTTSQNVMPPPPQVGEMCYKFWIDTNICSNRNYMEELQTSNSSVSLFVLRGTYYGSKNLTGLSFFRLM